MKFLYFAALVASTSAVTLNSEIYPHPDYYADGYSNTWKYSDMEHLVNETAYVDDIPAGDYSDPWIYNEGSFAGSGATDNVLVSLDAVEDDTLLYMQYQHMSARNQKLLEQDMHAF